jgi:hypothetical protein
MKLLIQLRKTTLVLLGTLLLACLGPLPELQAVVPAPDGGYPGGNTAEGQNALLNLTSGGFNTAVGFLSLSSNTVGSFNTAVGAGTLLANTGDQNTATGAGALLSNSTGVQNTANGAFALFSNTEGANNTAIGASALQTNTAGSFNTAMGDAALHENTVGNLNIAVGVGAGQNVTTASNVICIGLPGQNVSFSCYIGQIFGLTSSGGTAVFINSEGKLGTTTSSRRFKEEIQPMDSASEALFALKPVTFHYRKDIDSGGKSQFGLVAEDVEKLNPDLVVCDKDGKPYSVRYDQVNAMLLNEFLKEHRKVQQLTKDFETTFSEQQKQIEALTAGLEKVTAQLEVNKTAPQIVLNNQ